jgi:hypothetical protein
LFTLIGALLGLDFDLASSTCLRDFQCSFEIGDVQPCVCMYGMFCAALCTQAQKSEICCVTIGGDLLLGTWDFENAVR